MRCPMRHIFTPGEQTINWICMHCNILLNHNKSIPQTVFTNNNKMKTNSIPFMVDLVYILVQNSKFSLITDTVVQELEQEIVTLEEYLSSYVEELSKIRQNSMINTDKNPRNTTQVVRNDQKSTPIHYDPEEENRGERMAYAATIVNDLSLQGIEDSVCPPICSI